MSGKRERSRRSAPSGMQLWWRQHRAWVAGMSRKQKIRYRLLQALVVVAIVVIALFIGIRAWVKLPTVPDLPEQVVTEDGEISFDGADLPNVAKSGQRKGVYTFLVAGQDVASGSTDTILLFTFDTNNKTVNAISILRDTMVNTSATGGAQKRINAVYARNRGSSDLSEQERVEKGMNALKLEVSKLTGIYPNFYVLVQWEAIGELVDALGGVYFDVPFDMDYDDPAQDLHIHQEAGYRLLNGEDAMEVIRFRKSNDLSISLGDVGRTEIQRDFLSAVLKKCLEPATLLKAPSLAQVFLNNVDTDLSVGNLLAFAELAVGMDTENNVKFVSMPYTGVSYKGASLVVANEEELLELLNDGINPYNDDIKSSDLQLIYRNSDGSFGVTNGTLADPSMGRASSSSSGSSGGSDTWKDDNEPQVPIEPDDPTDTQPEDPGTSGESGSSSSSGSQGGDSSTTEPTDPGASGNGGDSSQPESPDQSQGGNTSGDGDSQTGTSGDGDAQSGSSGGETGGGESGQTGGSEGGNASGETGGSTEPPAWLNPSGREQAA